MQISWKMLNYFVPYAKSLQLHKDWAPSVKSCQINSTSALYCFTSNGFPPLPASASTGPGLGVIYGAAGMLEDVLVCVLVEGKFWEETFEGVW